MADDQANEKRGMRMMWIATIVIVLIIAGAMGWNMIYNPDTSATQTSGPPH